MFNAGVRGKRAKDSTGLITVGEHFNQQTFLVPTVTRFAVTDGSYVDTNDTAADTTGGQTIVLYGSGFAPGATVLVGSTTIGAVTFLDSGRLTFSSPALGSGSYTVFVTNANGGTGILVPGLVYSGVPTFTTAAGSLGSVYETTAISTTVVATGDAPITYALSSGSLPSGSTLSSSGTISGTAPVDGSSTTYSFTVQATDADNQDSVRSFSLTINTDVVSFSSPANNTTTTATQNSPISNVTVVATSAAGYGVLYTSSGLPTGLSMNTSTGIISGTPTVVASNTSIITATANTTTRTAALYLNWTINLPGDLFWKYAALLMSANTVPNGNTFNTDLSTFNNEVVVVADTKPNEFHPFKEGYYSNYFDGTGDYLTSTATIPFSLGTSNFTLECWVYTSVNGTQGLVSTGSGSSTQPYFYLNGLTPTLFYNSTAVATGPSIKLNSWNHIAFVRSETSFTVYVNGVAGTTASPYSDSFTAAGLWVSGNNSNIQLFTGYIANLRIIKGTALYTAAFTPPTGPLTYVANTSLLTCQSNKLIDNSNNNITITKNGDVTINPFNPFNGTPTTITVPDVNNYSMYFDGTGDYLSGPINYPFIRTGPFTIEFWVYQPSLAAKTLIFNAHWDVGHNGGFRLNLSASGAIVFDASTGTYNTYPNVFTSTSTITASTWSHIAIVRNSSNSISCYINGVLARTPVTYASSLSLSSDGNIGQLRIGAGIYDGGAADLFVGYISNLRIMNTDIYSGNFTPSNSPLALTQTSSANTVAITALPTNGNSVFFDGSSDYLTVPSNTWTTLAGQFTIEFWVNFVTTPTSNPFIGVGSSGGFSIYNDGTRITPNLFGTGNIFNSTFTIAGLILNKWYHIAVTRNDANLMTMWVDGVSVGSATTATTYTQGTWQIGNSNFRCHISNLRVANTCLYTSTFTPSTTPITAVANTILLTCQSSSISNNRIILDNGNNAYTITSVGDTIAKTLSPFANTPAILMAQANTVIDSSNNGITFTVSGDARPARNGPFANTTTVTLVGNEGSAYFDGTGDYLEIAHAGNQWIGASTDFTIECWFNYTGTTGGERTLIGKGHQGSPVYAQFTLVLTSSNMLQFLASTSGGSWEINISDSVAVITNSWNHVAICRSGSTVTMYKNGAVVGTPATNSGALYNHTAPIRIGQHMSGSNYTGYVSNARFVKGTALYTTPFVPSWAPLTPVANTVLLTAQTNLSSNTKSFVDESNFNNIITGTGNATLGPFSPFGSTWSGYFDGTTDYLSGSSSQLNFGSNDFSIEFWMWPVNTSTNSQIIFQAGSGNLAILLMTGGVIEPGQYQTAGISQSTAGAIVAGAWQHVVLTRTGTAFRTFINGVLRGYGTRSFTPNNSSYTIGGAASGTSYTGYISNFKVITNSIPNLYTTSSTTLGTTIFTTPTNPSVSEANTVLLTCNTNKFVDYSPANNAITRTGDASVSKFSPFSSVTVTPASYSGYFDGTGDYLVSANNTAFALGTGDFTFECWIYPTAWNASLGTIIDFRMPTGVSNQVRPSLRVTDNSASDNLGYLSFATGPGAQIYSYLPTINRWYHLAVVRLSGSTKLYVDGQQAGSTYTDTNDYGSSTQEVVIGQAGYERASTSTYFSGYISNVRIIKGTAIYTANNTPSTTPLTAVANTSLLTCQSTTFVDNSNNAFAIAVNGDAKPVTQNPFTDTVGAAINYSANTYGSSIYFDSFVAASGDFLSVSGIPIAATGQFTFEAWIYTDTVNSADAQLIYSQYTTSDANRWTINISTANKIAVVNPTLSVTGATTIVPNQWNHIAVTRDSSNTLRIFLNGVVDATSASYTYSIMQSPPRVGYYNNTPNDYFNGYMSSVRVVSGQALYTTPFVPSNQPAPVTANTTLLLASTVGPSVTNAIRNTNIETAGTARYVANNSPYYDTYSALFDGTGDYLAILTNSAFNIGTNSFTVEAWINTSSATQQTIFNISDTADSGYGAVRVQVLSNQTVQWLMGPGATWGVAVTAGSITLGTWNHIAITRNGSSVYFFINGLQVGTTQTYATSLTTGGTTYIGYNSGTPFAFNGYISNLRFINGNALYTANTTPSTAPLTKVANTSLLTCQSNKFIDNSNNAFTITKAGDVRITAVQPFAANNTSRFSSVYFPVKTDYLSVSTSYSGGKTQANLTTFPGDFTFECWVYPTDTTISTTWGIWDARNAGASAAAMVFNLSALASPVTGSWRISYYNGTSYYGTGIVLYNQWSHVAWVRSGTTMTFYVNGVAGGTATISGTQTAAVSSSNIYIGSKDNGLANYGTVGYIADLRITNGYARTITVPTAPYDIK